MKSTIYYLAIISFKIIQPRIFFKIISLKLYSVLTEFLETKVLHKYYNINDLIY